MIQESYLDIRVARREHILAKHQVLDGGVGKGEEQFCSSDLLKICVKTGAIW